ncbi:MAG: NAD(P)H-hydrate dehydratase [Erysipelotrichaceae bacterium]|nr:NAD(P)H-hydrate dehydratase [Erysipelotrichaceae bacterium]
MTKWIHTGTEARRIDSAAITQKGIPSLVLMEHAADQIVKALLKDFPAADRFAVLAGPGNNGADGLAAARLLQHAGKDVFVLMDPASRLSEEEKIHLTACRNLGIPIHGLDASLDRADVILDGLFGSGLSRNLSGAWAVLVQRANRCSAVKVSIDLPSGLNGDTGRIMNEAIAADKVYCLDCIKTGCLIRQGPEVCKSIEVLDITIPSSLHEQSQDAVRFLDEEEAAGLLEPRPDGAHKGTFGKVLMTGGSMAMQGALDMAFRGCFAAGAGTVTLFTPEDAARAIAAKESLAMIVSAPQKPDGTFSKEAAGQLAQIVNRYTAASCGNGMTVSAEAGQVVQVLLESSLPLVLDADSLNNLAGHPERLCRKAPLILTPHVREFSRLSGFETDEIAKNPFACARAFLQNCPDAALVLKSSWTLIASKEGWWFLDRPNSALAKGGSGDVLSGIITGLLAQGCSAGKAAALGVWLASASAERGKNCPWSWTPLETAGHLGRAFEDLIRNK